MTLHSNDLQDLYGLLNRYSHIYMVYDRAVEGLADEIADNALIGCSLAISADAEAKTMDTVLDICRFLLDFDADRDALVLAVGGGTLTDIVGFAASIYKRGVRCAYVPTTLLSQVDASIGGKTGVNFLSYKNILGTFAMPEFTYVCPRPLRTLAHRDLVSGFAELLKTFVIADAAAYEEAVSILPGITSDNVADLAPLIEKAARIKESVVAGDPLEKGLRRSLNLGHTFAHAIEWYELDKGTADPLTHGEAVAIGIVAAARMSEEKGLCRMGLAEKLASDLSGCGLPVDMPYPEVEISAAFSKDKKAVDGRPRFVLIKEIGEVII